METTLQIPGLDTIQKEIQELKEMVSVLNPMNKEDKYIPKTKMFEMFDLSTSTLRNREQDDSLAVYKIGNRTYYKLKDIHRLLENSRK